jgi:hypothetical protein
MNGCNGRASQFSRYGSQPDAAGRRRIGLAPRRQRAITHGSPSRRGLSRAHDERRAFSISARSHSRAGWVPTTTASTFSCGRGCGLSNLGLSTAVLRLIPQHRERDEQAALRGLLLGGSLLVFVGCQRNRAGRLDFIGCLGERVEAAYTVPAYLGRICIPILLRRRLRRELPPGPHRYAFALWLKRRCHSG